MALCPRTGVLLRRGWSEFPGGPVVRILGFPCWGPGPILGLELRSHKPRSMAKEKNKTNQKKKKRTSTERHTESKGQTLRVCQTREADA